MGYCCSKRELKADIETVYILPVENSLGLHKCSSKHLQKIFYRYSTGSHLSSENFTKAFSELSLNYTKFSVLYSKFKLPLDRYSTKQLTILAIFYGFGGKEEKLKILYEAYNEKFKNEIMEDEIENMIKDLLYVSGYCIPSYALSLKFDNIDLKDYISKLYSNGSRIGKYFSRMILNNSSKLSPKEFVETCLNNKELKNLLKPKKIRSFICEFEGNKRESEGKSDSHDESKIKQSKSMIIRKKFQRSQKKKKTFPR